MTLSPDVTAGGSAPVARGTPTRGRGKGRGKGRGSVSINKISNVPSSSCEPANDPFFHLSAKTNSQQMMHYQTNRMDGWQQWTLIQCFHSFNQVTGMKSSVLLSLTEIYPIYF